MKLSEVIQETFRTMRRELDRLNSETLSMRSKEYTSNNPCDDGRIFSLAEWRNGLITYAKENYPEFDYFAMSDLDVQEFEWMAAVDYIKLNQITMLYVHLGRQRSTKNTIGT
eukprot:UN26113